MRLAIAPSSAAMSQHRTSLLLEMRLLMEPETSMAISVLPGICSMFSTDTSSAIAHLAGGNQFVPDLFGVALLGKFCFPCVGCFEGVVEHLLKERLGLRVLGDGMRDAQYVAELHCAAALVLGKLVLVKALYDTGQLPLQRVGEGLAVHLLVAGENFGHVVGTYDDIPHRPAGVLAGIVCDDAAKHMADRTEIVLIAGIAGELAEEFRVGFGAPGGKLHDVAVSGAVEFRLSEQGREHGCDKPLLQLHAVSGKTFAVFGLGCVLLIEFSHNSQLLLLSNKNHTENRSKADSLADALTC